ncbi:MAG: hypothetical protein M3082_05920 [Candidatus Dormibacteraeota bacterium]|nr:hypothetical protein [Candidatus Dormibacteraeota bacterium]
MELPDVPTGILLVASVSLSLFFIPSAIAKFRDWRGFIEGLGDYAILPDRAVRPVAVALPVLECLLGLALLVGIAPSLIGALAAILITIFIVAVGFSLHRHRVIGCNCYGVAATSRIGMATIARNVVLLGLALVVTSLGTVARGPGWLSRSWGPGWYHVNSLSGALLVALMTFSCVALVYLLEWGLDTRRQSRSLRMSQAS